MLGILFSGIGTLFDEISTSLGKKEESIHQESLYAMGFFSMFWGWIFFIIMALLRNSFIFNPLSIPIISIRIVLDILQNHMIMVAIVKADRSTFGFLRVITIPILLGIDLILGYHIPPIQMYGIMVVAIGLLFLFVNHGIRRNGASIVAFTAVNAAITLTLFKYNITHYNSVEAEGIISMFVIMVYFFTLARVKKHENPLKLLAKPIFFSQSFMQGFSQVFNSFAYSFAPASVIATAIRAFAIMWTIIAGRVYFHEKHVLIKIICLVFLIGGLILLAI